MAEPPLDMLLPPLKEKNKTEFRRQLEALPLSEIMGLKFQEVLKFVFWQFVPRVYFSSQI